MKLTYLTSNPFKFREAKIILADQYGFDLEIMNPDFELYEIQAKTCAEVVAFTAKYGADKLGRPCLKSDTGLYLEALGGLPGPYNAYFDKQIGVEKFLHMIRDEKNRNARLEHCFAYCEPGKEPVVFAGGGDGTIAFGMISSLSQKATRARLPKLAIKIKPKRLTITAMQSMISPNGISKMY